jgi:hypothetical protein
MRQSRLPPKEQNAGKLNWKDVSGKRIQAAKTQARTTRLHGQDQESRRWEFSAIELAIVVETKAAMAKRRTRTITELSLRGRWTKGQVEVQSQLLYLQ